MKFRAFAAALLLTLLQQPARADFTTLAVLGDSLSDNGRLAEATAAATFGLFSVPSAPYFPGRFSNGPVWVDYYAAAHPDVTVVDFAMGGAFSGVLNGRDNAGDDELGAVPFFGSSLQTAVSGLNTQLPQVPNVSGSGTSFVLWIGANDINSALDIGFANPRDVVPTSLSNVGNAIGTLLALGANDVYVGNLPDLGRTPDGIASGRAADLSAATIDFNNGLLALVGGAGAKVHLVDMFTPFNFLLAHAGDFGYTDTTTSCVDGLLDSTACANPQDHLFWDNIHPTTGVHAVMAQVFTNSFAAAPVPLPGGALLMAPLSAWLVTRRRARHAGRAAALSPPAPGEKC
ncbi:MAG: SGNH/GDSL hydrolase family protein [Gammaproteobacteria bacterium]|nr:SGNH/GDSL hydrolase family protein [Gammaproteobacteria bacterium]